MATEFLVPSFLVPPFLRFLITGSLVRRSKVISRYFVRLVDELVAGFIILTFSWCSDVKMEGRSGTTLFMCLLPGSIAHGSPISGSLIAVWLFHFNILMRSFVLAIVGVTRIKTEVPGAGGYEQEIGSYEQSADVLHPKEVVYFTTRLYGQGETGPLTYRNFIKEGRVFRHTGGGVYEIVYNETSKQLFVSLV